MLSVWTWIVANRKLVGIVSALLALVLYVGHLKIALAEAEKDSVTCTMTLDEQNRAIAHMAEEGKARASRSAKAALDILKRPSKPIVGKDADALNKWLETQ